MSPTLVHPSIGTWATRGQSALIIFRPPSHRTLVPQQSSNTGTEHTSAEITSRQVPQIYPRGRCALLVSQQPPHERTCWPAFHQPGRVELRTHFHPASPSPQEASLKRYRHAIPRRSPLAARVFRLGPWLEHDGTAREIELSCRSPRAAAAALPFRHRPT